MKKVNQIRSKDKVKLVETKENGRTTGFQIHHWDGRQAAVVRPDTVRYKLRRD